MKKEIEIHVVSDELPDEMHKVLCFGEAAGASPNMGGGYWFITYRFNKPPKHMGERYIDNNGFVATYVTHWCELPERMSTPTTF